MILRNWASIARMSLLSNISETSAQCLLAMEESLINLWARWIVVRVSQIEFEGGEIDETR